MLKKRILSVVLCLCMMTGLIPRLTLIAEAHSDNGGYPYNVASGVYIGDEWGFYKCECTSFVAYCLNTRNGFAFNNTMYGIDDINRWGDAKHWKSVALLHGFTVDDTPSVGAVAWNGNGRYGHVAWVCKVNGNNVTIDEYNYGYNGMTQDADGDWHGNHRYNTRTVPKTDFQYIHFPVNGSPSQPSNPHYATTRDLGADFYAYIYHPHSGCNIENRSNNVQLASVNQSDPRQLWHFIRQDDTSYKIINMYDGRCLDTNGGTDRGVQVLPYNGNELQK